MLLSLDKKIMLLLLFALLVLAATGYFAYRNADSLQNAVRWERHTTEILVDLDETLIAVLNVETGARGFALTGNEDFLAPHSEGRQEAAENIEQLRILMADNPAQIQQLMLLERQIADKINWSESNIDIRRNQGASAAPNRIVSREGKVLMDFVRATIGQMKDDEISLLKIRGNSLQRSLKINYWVTMLGSLIGTALLLFAAYVVYFEIRNRRIAEKGLIEANRELENRVAERTRELEAASKKAVSGEIFSRDILNSFSAHVAVLNKSGVIIEVNNAWEKFARSNGVNEELNKTGIGQNYLSVCGGDACDSQLQTIKKNLDAVLKREINNFAVEYPCHAPHEQRWFLMQVNTMRGDDGGAVVSHYNITDRVKAEKQSEQLYLSERQARREAEIANRLRDDFMASVSHELRTPLNSILGWARLLENGKLDGEVSEKAVKTIIRNAETQNHLIEDLLDIARIISGKLTLEFEDVNPRELISAAIETVKPSAEAKSIKIDFDFEINADRKIISADPNRLQQIILNLLTNAIKFSPESGAIKLGLRRKDDFVFLTVTDNGAGIKPEFLPFVFEPYRQDLNNAKKSGGLGLGLSIVRQLTELHGGAVSVESDGENLGSTFFVKLPVIDEQKMIKN